MLFYGKISTYINRKYKLSQLSIDMVLVNVGLSVPIQFVHSLFPVSTSNFKHIRQPYLQKLKKKLILLQCFKF